MAIIQPLVTLAFQVLLLAALGYYLYRQARRHGGKNLRLGLTRYFDLSCEAPEQKSQRLKASLTEVLQAAANAELLGTPGRKIASLQVVLKDSGQVWIEGYLTDGGTTGLVCPSIESFVETLTKEG